MSDQAIVGAIGGVVIGAIVLAIGLLYIRARIERYSAARQTQQAQSQQDDESYFAGLRFTDETWQQARREHGWCTCLRARSTSDDDRIPDPDCPVHQEIAR